MKLQACLLALVLAALASAAAGALEGLDVTKATIQSTMSALPADDDVLIEFFASWCPACRAFKPEFEKATAFLLKNSKVHVYRLDCAVDPDICDKYKVSGYPTLYLGKASDVAAVTVDKLTKFDYGLFKRDGAGVVQFVSKQLSLDLTYKAEEGQAEPEAKAAGATDAKSSASSGTQTATVAAGQWTPGDVEAATRQLFKSITGFHPTEGVHERRAALLMLLKMWGAGHPLPQCRSGAAGLVKALPQLWPEDAEKDPWGDDSSMTKGDGKPKAPTDICSASAAAVAAAAAAEGSVGTGVAYEACKGSKPDTRGFTCGLWLLFHTNAARLPEKDGGALLVSALQGFAKYFFQCEVCRAHFVKITATPEASAVRSRRDGVMWLWRVHNEVNARLAQVESKYGHSSTGDPAFPKQQWPSPAECPKCRLPSDTAVQPGSTGSTDQAAVAWNEDEVYRFLVKHYGRHADTPLAAGAKELSSSRERATGGGSAIMQAALEAEEDASPGGYFGSVFTMAAICSVFVFAVLVMWARSAFGLTRRPSGGKGTWSLGHRYGAANGMPRHGRSMIRGKVAF